MRKTGMREFIYFICCKRSSPGVSRFSPFELVFGHAVRGPLKLLKEKWLTETSSLNLLDYVSNFKERLYNACKLD
jgi:hypothetical protein